MKVSGSSAALQVLTGSFFGKFINLVALALVTPHLGPSGFGQLVVVGIILGIFNIVIDIGFENYYIYRTKINGPERTSAEDIETIEHIVFTLRFYSNLILFIAQIVASFALTGILFDSPVDTYLRILSLNYLFAIPGRINEIRFKKRMQFKVVAQSKVLGDLLGATTKVILVFSGLGLVGWAIGIVAGGAVNTIYLAWKGDYKPRLIAIPVRWRKEVFWFARHSWLSGVGIYLNNQIGNILLKAYMPLNNIGYLQFGYSYTVEIQSGILASQLHVMLPYYSNFQHDKPRVSKAINQLIELSLLVMGGPAIIGAVYAEELVIFLFGEVWRSAVPIVQIYCCYVVMRILVSPCLSILSALGKMKETTFITYSNLIVGALASLFVLVFTKSIIWYAVAFAATGLATEYVKAILGLKLLKIAPTALFLDVKMNLICLAILFCAAFALRYFYQPEGIFELAFSFGLLLAVLFIIQFYLNRKVFMYLFEKLKISTSFLSLKK